MRKKIIIPALFVMLTTVAMAQSPIGEGGRQFNFGFGLYESSMPIYMGLDFGVHRDITVGPQIGFDLGLDYLSLGGRGDYHFNTLLSIPQDWDFYAGLNVGFAVGLNNDRVSGLDLGLQVGGRYYWNQSWGINLEFGGGPYVIGGGKIGLSKRF